MRMTRSVLCLQNLSLLLSTTLPLAFLDVPDATISSRRFLGESHRERECLLLGSLRLQTAPTKLLPSRDLLGGGGGAST